VRAGLEEPDVSHVFDERTPVSDVFLQIFVNAGFGSAAKAMKKNRITSVINIIWVDGSH